MRLVDQSLRAVFASLWLWAGWTIVVLGLASGSGAVWTAASNWARSETGGKYSPMGAGPEEWRILPLWLAWCFLGITLQFLLSLGAYRFALRHWRREAVSEKVFLSGWDVLPQLAVLAVGSTLFRAAELAIVRSYFRPWPALWIDLVIWLIAAPCVAFVLPILADSRCSVRECVGRSLRLWRRNAWRTQAAVLLLAFASQLGLLACGIGVLASFPIYLVGIARLYLELGEETRPEGVLAADDRH